jgi:aminobenzoyl-glutamate utilization protein B
LKTKQDVIRWLGEHADEFIHLADQIWARPELAWEEVFSSRLQADYLESQGFRITWNVAGMPTAFCAEWGSGRPVLGFAGEYDALPGLSQKVQTSPEPVVAGGPGHGCGHNLLGTGCLAAAAAARYWLEANGKPGTLRYYGCPAEEGGGAKTFMARAGTFDDLDAALNFHPDQANYAMKGSNLGIYHLRFRFHGIAAHAGSAPHLGRSALDAVELMNVGVNYLREHVTSDVRIHYAITHGGDAPNIVPAEAEVSYLIRAHQPDTLEQVTERVRKVAAGAAMMTETQMEIIFDSAFSSLLNNHYLADLQYEAMKWIGPIEYTPEELAFAQGINDHYPAGNVEALFKTLRPPAGYAEPLARFRGRALISENFPSLDEGAIRTSSTDVGDLSRVAPLSLLRTTCAPTGAPAHGWGFAAAAGMSIGHKGMLHAARIMALTAVDLLDNPLHIQKAREEFELAMQEMPYHCPMPAEVQPPS